MLLLAAGHIKFDKVYSCNYNIQVFLVLKFFQKTCKYTLFEYIQVHIIHLHHVFKNN